MDKDSNYNAGTNIMALSTILVNDSVSPRELKDYIDGEEKVTVVCPSPVVADAVRASLQKQGSEAHVITVAKFVNDLLSFYLPERELVRKSDLKLMLSVIWKARFQEAQEISFHQCFDILTDLRSYTLRPELIESVLEKFSPKIAECVRYFWLMMEGQEIVDEHLAYELLIQCLGDTDIENYFTSEAKIIFTGFSHLSGNQISFLKVLSKRNHIFVPIPLGVYLEKQNTDWVFWLDLESDHCIEAKDEMNRSLEVTCHPYPKGKLNFYLAEVESDFDNFIYSKNEISHIEVVNTPAHDIFFRTKSTLVEDIFSKVLRDADEKFFFKRDDQIETSLFVTTIEDLYKKTLSKSDKMFKEFAHLKVLDLLKESVERWRDLSEVNEVMTAFDLKILGEVTLLDLPRIFSQPLTDKYDKRLVSLKELGSCDQARNIILIGSEHDLKATDSGSYGLDVYDLLKDLGPIRQKSLEVKFLLAHMKSLIAQGQTTIMLEKGLEKHDSVISELCESLVINERQIVLSDQNHKDVKTKRNTVPDDYKKIESISASRLQTYLDCPAKFYYSYVKKIGQDPQAQATLDPRNLGSLEHKVVERFCNELWAIEDLASLVKEEIPNYFSPQVCSHKNLYDEALSEGISYTQIFCSELLRLKEIDKEVEFLFEVEMKSSFGVGRADLLIKSKVFGNILLDMKRSGGSIPSKSAIEKLTKIQLWYYDRFLEEELDGFGYVNLSATHESLLFTFHSTLNDFVVENHFLGLEKTQVFKEDLGVYRDDFRQLHDRCLSEINNADTFSVDPVNAQACTFCPGSLICPKK